MSFSEFDACASTFAVARFKRYKQRILSTQKHVHNKSIVVLKNSAQNGRYMAAYSMIHRKDSNSYDFSLRIGSTIFTLPGYKPLQKFVSTSSFAKLLDIS